MGARDDSLGCLALTLGPFGKELEQHLGRVAHRRQGLPDVVRHDADELLAVPFEAPKARERLDLRGDVEKGEQHASDLPVVGPHRHQRPVPEGRSPLGLIGKSELPRGGVMGLAGLEHTTKDQLVFTIGEHVEVPATDQGLAGVA